MLNNNFHHRVKYLKIHKFFNLLDFQNMKNLNCFQPQKFFPKKLVQKQTYTFLFK